MTLRDLSPAARRLLRLLGHAGHFRLHRLTDRLEIEGYGYVVPVREGDREAAEWLIAEELVQCIQIVDNELYFALSRAGLALARPGLAWEEAKRCDRFAWRITEPLPQPNGRDYTGLAEGHHEGVGEVSRCPICGLMGKLESGYSFGKRWTHGTLWWCDRLALGK